MENNINSTINSSEKNSSKNESFSMSKGIVVGLNNDSYNDYKYGYENNNNIKNKKNYEPKFIKNDEDISAKGIIKEIDNINNSENKSLNNKNKENIVFIDDLDVDNYQYDYGYDDDNNAVVSAKPRKSNENLVKKGAAVLGGLIAAGALLGGGYYTGKTLASAIKNGKFDDKKNANSGIDNNGNSTSNNNGTNDNNGTSNTNEANSGNNSGGSEIDTAIHTDNNNGSNTDNKGNNSGSNNQVAGGPSKNNGGSSKSNSSNKSSGGSSNSNNNISSNTSNTGGSNGGSSTSNTNTSDNKSGNSNNSNNNSSSTKDGKSGNDGSNNSSNNQNSGDSNNGKTGSNDGKTGGMTPPKKEEVTGLEDKTDSKEKKTGGMAESEEKESTAKVAEDTTQGSEGGGTSGSSTTQSVPSTASSQSQDTSSYSSEGFYINPMYVKFAIDHLKNLTKGNNLENILKKLKDIVEPDCAPKDNSYLRDAKTLLEKSFKLEDSKNSPKKYLERLEKMWDILNEEYEFSDFDLGLMELMDAESMFEDGEISYYDAYEKASKIAEIMRKYVEANYTGEEKNLRFNQINQLMDMYETNAFFELMTIYQQSLSDDSVKLTSEQQKLFDQEFAEFDAEMKQLNTGLQRTYDTKVRYNQLGEDVSNKFDLLDDLQKQKMYMWLSIKTQELSKGDLNSETIKRQLSTYNDMLTECGYSLIKQIPEDQLSTSQKDFKIYYGQYENQKEAAKKTKELNKDSNELANVNKRIDELIEQMKNKSYNSAGMEVHSTGVFTNANPQDYVSFEDLAANNKEYQDLLKRRDELTKKTNELMNDIDILNDLNLFAFTQYSNYKEYSSNRIYKIERSSNINGYKEYYDKDGNLLTDVTEEEIALYLAQNGGYKLDVYSYKDENGKVVKIKLSDLEKTVESLEYLMTPNPNSELDYSERIDLLNYLNNTQSQETFKSYFWTNVDLGNKIEGKRRSDAWIADLADDWVVLRDGHVALEGMKNGLIQHLEGWSNFFTADGKLDASDYKQMFDSQGMIQQFKEYGYVLNSENEIFTSIGNMLPSIAVSALGPWFGATELFSYAGTFCMFMSAGGNAKEQGMQSGMTEEQALAYGILCGASEALLEKFIGGVTGLSDDDAAKKIAGFLHCPEFFAKMLSEGNEEFVQELLDPMFKVLVTGQWDGFDMEAAIKSGLYGMITAGILNSSGSVISSNFSTFLTGNPNLLPALLSLHQNEGFVLNQNFLNECEILRNSADSYDTIKQMMDNDVTKSQYDELLKENPKINSDEFTYENFLERAAMGQILEVSKSSPEVQKLSSDITKLNEQIAQLSDEYNKTKNKDLLKQIKDLKSQVNSKTNEMNTSIKNNMDKVPFKLQEFMDKYMNTGNETFIDALIKDNHLNMDLYNKLESLGEQGVSLKAEIDNYLKGVKGGTDGYISNTIKNKIASRIININSIADMQISDVENIKGYKYKLYSYKGNLLTYNEFASLFNNTETVTETINTETNTVNEVVSDINNVSSDESTIETKTNTVNDVVSDINTISSDESTIETKTNTEEILNIEDDNIETDMDSTLESETSVDEKNENIINNEEENKTTTEINNTAEVETEIIPEVQEETSVEVTPTEEIAKNDESKLNVEENIVNNSKDDEGFEKIGEDLLRRKTDVGEEIIQESATDIWKVLEGLSNNIDEKTDFEKVNLIDDINSNEDVNSNKFENMTVDEILEQINTDLSNVENTTELTNVENTTELTNVENTTKLKSIEDIIGVDRITNSLDNFLNNIQNFKNQISNKNDISKYTDNDIKALNNAKNLLSKYKTFVSDSIKSKYDTAISELDSVSKMISDNIKANTNDILSKLSNFKMQATNELSNINLTNQINATINDIINNFKTNASNLIENIRKFMQTLKVQITNGINSLTLTQSQIAKLSDTINDIKSLFANARVNLSDSIRSQYDSIIKGFDSIIKLLDNNSRSKQINKLFDSLIKADKNGKTDTYGNYVTYGAEYFDVLSVRQQLYDKYKNLSNVDVLFWTGSDTNRNNLTGRFFNVKVGVEPDLAYRNMFKIYVPFNSQTFATTATEVFDYLVYNNITSNNKIANTSRTDAIVLRIPNVNDAIKVMNFINNNPRIQGNNCLPLSLKYGKVNIAMDGLLSYNSVVIKILNKYFKENVFSGGKVDLEGFREYVDSILDDVYNKHDPTKLFQIFNELDADAGKMNNYLEVVEIIKMAISDDFKIEDFLRKGVQYQSKEWQAASELFMEGILYGKK